MKSILYACIVTLMLILVTATFAQTSDLVGPDSYPNGINPLTGLPFVDATASNRRPIVVKISNSPPLVRPQAGLGEADLVFEHYTEAGITRFSAVYYGYAPSRVGSIRSARLIDYELAPMYQAFLMFSGGSTGVEELIYGTEAMGIVEERMAEGKPILPPSDFVERAYRGVNYGYPSYWRDDTIAVPHNLFGNPNAIWELATAEGKNTAVELKGMAFSSTLPAGSIGVANTLDIRYETTRAQWFYQPDSNQYQRMTDGILHYDGNTLEPIMADNVVVLFAGHHLTDIVESVWQDNVSWSMQILVWPHGDALLFRDGQAYLARWIRPTRPDLIRLETLEGMPLALKPGQTWYQVVRTTEQMNPTVEWVRYE